MVPVNLEAVAAELRAEHPDLPHGIGITVDHLTDNLLVGNDKLGFVVTRANIADNLHKSVFEASLKHLILILDQGLQLINPHLFGLIKNG